MADKKASNLRRESMRGGGEGGEDGEVGMEVSGAEEAG